MFTLFYKKTRIGDIERESEDFPSFYGKIININQNIPKNIQDYIEYSKISCDLIDKDSKKESEKFEKKNEGKFKGLIEGNWEIIDENNKSIPILIPLFRRDTSIVWRLKI